MSIVLHSGCIRERFGMIRRMIRAHSDARIVTEGVSCRAPFSRRDPHGPTARAATMETPSPSSGPLAGLETSASCVAPHSARSDYGSRQQFPRHFSRSAHFGLLGCLRDRVKWWGKNGKPKAESGRWKCNSERRRQCRDGGRPARRCRDRRPYGTPLATSFAPQRLFAILPPTGSRSFFA